MTGQNRKEVLPGSFAARLREAQKEAGLSNRELAARLDISESLLGKWRRGDLNPLFSTVARIAAATDKPLDFFAPQDEVAA